MTARHVVLARGWRFVWDSEWVSLVTGGGLLLGDVWVPEKDAEPKGVTECDLAEFVLRSLGWEVS